MISLMLVPSEVKNKLTLYCNQGAYSVVYDELTTEQQGYYDAFLEMVEFCNMGQINFGENNATIEGMIPVDDDPISDVNIDSPTVEQIEIIQNLLTYVFLIEDGI